MAYVSMDFFGFLLWEGGVHAASGICKSMSFVRLENSEAIISSNPERRLLSIFYS